MRPNDKLLAAKFHPAPCGLQWVESTDKDILPDGEFSDGYTTWLLVDPKTDRMIASIDEPYSDKICFHVGMETGQQRKFISLEGAKRWAIAASIEILRNETIARAQDRKCRRIERTTHR